MGAESPCTAEQVNNAFIEASTEINDVIADRTKQYKSLWRDMIDRVPFVYGEGYIKETNVFHGGTIIQDAGESWYPVQESRAPGTNGPDDPGYDACRYEAEIIGHGFETKNFQLYQTCRRTYDVCLKDVLFKWKFRRQLQLLYNNLTNITLGEWEQITREFYLGFCDKYWVAAGGSTYGLEEFTLGLFGRTITIPPGPGGGLPDIGRLTQEVLNRFYQFLVRQCPMAAIGMADGMPQFTIVTSPETSTEVIRSDSTRNTDMRYVNQNFLIEGYGTVKQYQGWAHVHDIFTPRFKVDSTGANLERVFPYRTQPTTIGDAVDVDPEYVNAPYELSIVFLKDVLQLQIPPPNPSEISGHEFEPYDNYGEFHWINIRERSTNLLGEKGFFFARFEGAAEPLEYSTDCVAILHRRCIDVPIEICGTCETTEAVAVVSCAQFDETEDADTATEYLVELADCLPCEPGQEVTVTFVGTTKVCAHLSNFYGNGVYKITFATTQTGGWCDYDSGMAGGTIECGCEEEQ